MNPYNKYTLKVLEELESDPYFYRENHLINYNIPREGEVFDGSKVIAVWNLRDLGAIKIHNEEKIGQVNGKKALLYEFQIIIIHPVFRGVYDKCCKEVMGQTLRHYKQHTENAKKKASLKKLINDVIYTRKLGKKQKILLLALSGFKPKNKSELISKTGTKSLKSLKSLLRDTRKKIKGTVLNIRCLRSGEIGRENFYQLDFAPPKDSP